AAVRRYRFYLRIQKVVKNFEADRKNRWPVLSLLRMQTEPCCLFSIDANSRNIQIFELFEIIGVSDSVRREKLGLNMEHELRKLQLSVSFVTACQMQSSVAQLWQKSIRSSRMRRKSIRVVVFAGFFRSATDPCNAKFRYPAEDDRAVV